ncbi:DUF1643 domain-containing protein [Variovorax sp. RTB1]|uniref:DUF1643 domain-containing protein n=1 Tax=Variovorax sp. RTB1 TaxID=3048631 RepID=UPI002B224FCF|nr:DUF1643 domain-containing protein [Variovorax sp. RTB1]
MFRAFGVEGGSYLADLFCKVSPGTFCNFLAGDGGPAVVVPIMNDIFPTANMAYQEFNDGSPAADSATPGSELSTHRPETRTSLVTPRLVDKPHFDIYHCDHSDAWRFAVGRSGRKSLVAIGVHACLAQDEDHDDAIARAEAMAERYDCDGLVVMNLCPIRASSPHDLPWSIGADAYQRNMLELVRTITSAAGATVWGDWEHAGVRDYLGRAREDLLERVADTRVRWVAG